MNPLRKLVDQASHYAEAVFDPEESFFPHFIAVDATGGITVVTMALAGADLDRGRRDAETRFRLDRYQRWVFFAEAWMADIAAGDRVVDPVDHPERIEVVQFQGLDLVTGHRYRGSRQILRAPDVCRLLPLVEGKADRSFDRPAVIMSEHASAGAGR